MKTIINEVISGVMTNSFVVIKITVIIGVLFVFNKKALKIIQSS